MTLHGPGAELEDGVQTPPAPARSAPSTGPAEQTAEQSRAGDGHWSRGERKNRSDSRSGSRRRLTPNWWDCSELAMRIPRPKLLLSGLSRSILTGSKTLQRASSYKSASGSGLGAQARGHPLLAMRD